MTRLLITPAFALISLAIPASASLVIADTLGPGDNYIVNLGWPLGAGAMSGNAGWSAAMPFAASETLTFAGFDVAASLGFGENTLLVSLQEDASGVPGTVLESLVIMGQMQAFGNLNPVVSAASVARPTLTAGATYWLSLSVPDLLNDWSAWNENSLDVWSDLARREGDGAWIAQSGSRQGAFRIYADTPEPGTLGLLGVGTLAILLCRRRTRTDP